MGLGSSDSQCHGAHFEDILEPACPTVCTEVLPAIGAERWLTLRTVLVMAGNVVPQQDRLLQPDSVSHQQPSREFVFFAPGLDAKRSDSDD